MKTKVNPALLGAFLVLGTTLLVASLIVFGSGRLFRKPVQFVIVFPESVNGLSEGAPVKFKGVAVGQVTRLAIGVGTNGLPANIQIYSQINRDQWQDRSGDERLEADLFSIPLLVKRGLRASIEIESFVTGQLYVSLDMLPDAEPAELVLSRAGCPEVPVQTAGLKEFLNSLQELNVGSLATKADNILGRLETILGQIEMERLNRELVGTLSAARSLLEDPSTTNLVASLQSALDETRGLAADLRERAGPLSERLGTASEKATASLEEIEGLAADLRRLTAPDSPTVVGLQQALQDLSRAVNSLRLLADSLNRNPSAILTGRQFTSP